MHLTLSTLALGASLSLLSLALSFGIAAYALVHAPADRFVRGPGPWLPEHSPPVRLLLRGLRNLAGLLLIVLGLLLSLPGVPGQGLLTVLAGLLLAELPGKERLLRRLIRIRAVHQTIDRLRARFGRAPLVRPSSSEDDESSP